jgi:hypothetical protein
LECAGQQNYYQLDDKVPRGKPVKEENRRIKRKEGAENTYDAVNNQ